MKRPRQRRQSQAGMTIIELLIAMVVLAVGLGGVLVLFTAAIAGNSRSKVDTQAVQLSQTVLETLAAVPGDAAAKNITIRDCANNARTITNAVGGAVLDANGDIDWSQAATRSVDYVSCGANGTQTTYEVRWQISIPYSDVKFINVSSRMKNAPRGLGFFSIPVTLHTMAGK